MNVTESSLQRVDEHWAVMALGSERRDRGMAVSAARLVERTIGRHMKIDFRQVDDDDDVLYKLASAYELAAIEGLDAFLNPTSDQDELREQCAAGAWRAFDLLRLLDVPQQDEARIFHILHLSALAYCGDRWSDLRRWYNENPDLTGIPSTVDVAWHYRVLYRLFECWVRLFRKNGWNDLHNIQRIVDDLRTDQQSYEATALDSGSDIEDQTMALRLIGLYHLAKATELLAIYVVQGEPVSISTLLDKHFEAAAKAASIAIDPQLELIIRWLHAASRQMVSGSIWWVARSVNSRTSKFVREVTKHRSLFELLPPQRAALLEHGLLDQAATAVVIDMPTSGGKTLLAQFRILQALNQFDRENGWVAYVVPTRALASQITRRLRKDFEPIGVRVEVLSGAIEIDALEEDLLRASGERTFFDVLVSTPEKLQLIIRNNKVPRPLALVVMDEAQNLEDESRGLRIELLLATIKSDCSVANFLLLMPSVENTETLARWLAHDVQAGRSISFGTTPWTPNERIVGVFSSQDDDSVRAGWLLRFQTLTTTPRTIHLEGTHQVGEVKPLPLPKSRLTNSLKTAAMATVFSQRGTSVAIALRIDSVWTMAREIAKVLPLLSPVPEEIKLVQKFLQTEISPNFELVNLLDHGIAVHHAGLSDDARALIEWLVEEEKVRVLCATTTIVQGINFPVSSVFLASRFVPGEKSSKEMSSRAFWNLAGRVGRIDHDSVGVIGVIAGDKPNETIEFVERKTGDLLSRLQTLLTELEEAGNLSHLESVIYSEQWEDFRCYVAHLWNSKRNLGAVLEDTEQLLRNTLGYNVLRSRPDGKAKADKLLEATKKYAQDLGEHPERATLADMTGFSVEGVSKALHGLSTLERKLDVSDWTPASLFGSETGMADLYGVMLRVPQLEESLRDIAAGDQHDSKILAEVTQSWVKGFSIEAIASMFQDDQPDKTKAITEASKAIYRSLVTVGSWGFAALSQLAGLDYDSMSDADRRRINTLPAMVYHGVNTEEAVLMRMNAVPRSIAQNVGKKFLESIDGNQEMANVRGAREFLRDLDKREWERLRPETAHLNGSEYKKIWELLSGEGNGLQ